VAAASGVFGVCRCLPGGSTRCRGLPSNSLHANVVRRGNPLWSPSKEGQARGPTPARPLRAHYKRACSDAARRSLFFASQSPARRFVCPCGHTTNRRPQPPQRCPAVSPLVTSTCEYYRYLTEVVGTFRLPQASLPCGRMTMVRGTGPREDRPRDKSKIKRQPSRIKDSGGPPVTYRPQTAAGVSNDARQSQWWARETENAECGMRSEGRTSDCAKQSQLWTRGPGAADCGLRTAD